jgi:hypothetical protein
MHWVKEIRNLLKDPALLFCLSIIIISIIISWIMQSIDAFPNKTIVDFILKIIAGAGGGGFLTITVINSGTRKRSRLAYNEIISNLCDLFLYIYANIKYGDIRSIHGDLIIEDLIMGADRTKDVSESLVYVKDLLKKQAKDIGGNGKYYMPYKHKIMHTLRDLTYIYLRDAIYNTNDDTILKELYHATALGSRILGSLKGYGAMTGNQVKGDQLYLLSLFREVSIQLYQLMLIKGGLPLAMKDSRIEIQKNKPHA